jgi:propanediol utilization protein
MAACVDPSFALARHMDTDEANATNVQTDAQGYIEGIQREGWGL